MEQYNSNTNESSDQSQDPKRFEEVEGSNAIIRLLEKFENVTRVLENAALTAVLMNFIFNNNHEYYSLLYYYTVKKYIRINETKNSMRNYHHINLEIYTVFIHPKSILPIPLKNDELRTKVEENISSEICAVYFHKISKLIVSEFVAKYVEEFREHIRSGDEIFSYKNRVHEDLGKVAELNILAILHKSIHTSLVRSQKSRCLPLQLQDMQNLQILYDFQISALTKAMDTQYEHFLFSKRYSFVTTAPELQSQLNTFLQSSPTKVVNKQRIKGHSFVPDSISTACFCLVCELIVWGPHPQCLHCRNCKKAVHFDCKDMVKICQIDIKIAKKRRSVSTYVESERECEGPRRLENVTKELTKLMDINIGQNDLFFDFTNDGADKVSVEKVIEKPKSRLKPSNSKIFEFKKEYSPRPSGVKYVSSMKNLKKNETDNITRSKSARAPSPKRSEELKREHLHCQSVDSGIEASLEPLPTFSHESDPEMLVLETFQPEIEIIRFSSVSINTGAKPSPEYHRLLVLMEFHHNIKFIRMTLKRLMYFLVEPWIKMGDHLDLFYLLSLNCIDQLYTLIGSLVDVIDSCETTKSYDSTMVDKVLNWFSVDDENNLLSWLHLSTNLCCTNILQSVKVIWTEHKQMYPKLNDLFSVEINRIVIINQLSNMRPLLFNLPMIVNKIIKDLKKFSQFKDEVKSWKVIHEKISRLPKLIDERCMPVVQLINNGTILTSNIKYKQRNAEDKFNEDFERYIDQFPNSIFKNSFVDFQFVKISNLSRSYSKDDKNSGSSAVFVREEQEAAIICYEKEMVFLQKENDRYILKRFKSIENCKLFPVIRFHHVHVSKQTTKDNKVFCHQLSILVISHVTLAQILFKEEAVRDRWFDQITKASSLVKSVIDRTPKSSVDLDLDCVDCKHLDIAVKDDGPKKAAYKSVNHIITKFDLISNELSTDSIPDGTLEAADQSESSSEFADEEEFPDNNSTRTECQTIQNYIEEVIAEALNRIQYNSKSGNSDD